METYTTDAINIKTYALSESDNIIVMLSKEMGLIRGIAKGVKKPKSKLGARMQSLVANNVCLDKRKNLDIIKEASVLNPFNNLRGDFDKLTSALYILEVINNFYTDNEDKEQNERVYDILYKTLENIQNAKSKAKITLMVIKFQLLFMKEMGFMLEFSRCLKCSKPLLDETTVLFSHQTGGVCCLECGYEQVQYVRMHYKIREFLSEINKNEIGFKTKYDDLINENVANSCFNLLKKYIETISCKKSKASKVMEETKVS